MAANQTEVLTFAHLTDVHLPIPVRPTFSELLGKRALGYLSWLRRRQFWHRQEVSDALVADIRSMGVEAVFLSGDLVNISTKAEFETARDWLVQQFSDLPVALAPGNHDAYVMSPWADSLGLLAGFMSGVRDGRGPPGPARDAADFPFTRDIGPARLVVANSSPPTAPGLASGALGARQIEAIERDLNRAAEDQRFAILMLHHPINDGVVARRKALDDRAALAAAIGRAGVDLVLHGHAHVAHFGAVATPHGAAPVIGGAAASHPRAGGKYAPGRYNHFRLQKTPEGVRRLDLAVREFDPRTGAAQTVMTRSFEGGEAKMRAKA